MAGANATKERIRVVAEKLFAQNGFHNTSLRTITSAAKVNLAAVNYHYGSKEALLEAIFDHHLVPLNTQRYDRLVALKEQSIASGTPPKLETILRAFIEPSMAFRADKKARAVYFIALVGQAFHAPDDTLRRIFFTRVGPVLDLFSQLLSQALPHLSATHLARTLSFIVGAINAPLMVPRPDHLSTPETVVDSPAEVELLLDFIIHGLGHHSHA